MNNLSIIDAYRKMCEGDTSTSNRECSFEPYTIHVIDDKNVLKRYKNEIFQLIQGSYKDKGGFLGADNPKTLVKDIDRAKLVFDRTGQVIACSLYRTDMDGFKRFGSGSIIGDETARTFVDQIIKTDIEPYNGWYWGESSDAIEHIFKKFGGNPIPNSLAREILRIDADDTNFRLDDDGVHYIRLIRGEMKRKMIFGFKDEETRQKAENAVRDYGEFKLRTNSSISRISESNDDVCVMMNEARTYLSRLFDLHYEEGFNEILPEWRVRLVYSMKLIKDNIGTIKPDKRNGFLSAVCRGETCYENMDVLRFFKIIPK